MDGLYFELLPQELLYKIRVRSHGIPRIYSLIKLFNLDYDTTFRLTSIYLFPSLNRYKLHEEFRNRRISWHNIYEDINKCENISSPTESLSLSLSEVPNFYQAKDLIILILEEYVVLSHKENHVDTNDELLIYESLIVNLISIQKLNKNEYSGFLEPYKDIIRKSTLRYYDRLELYPRCHRTHLSMLRRVSEHLHIYIHNKYIVTWDPINVLGILDKENIRYLTDIEIRVVKMCGFGIVHDPQLLSYNKYLGT